MARVVTRSSGQLYLLIVFVFLFLIMTTVAALLYMDGDEMAKGKDSEAGAHRETKKESKIYKAEKERATKEITGGEGGELQPALSESDKSYDYAKERFETVFQDETYPRRGLAYQVKLLADRLEDLHGALEQAEKTAADRVADIARRDGKFKALDTKHTTNVRTLERKVTDTEARADQREKDQRKVLDDTRATQKTTVDDYKERLTGVMRRLSESETKAGQLTMRNDALRREIAILKGLAGVGARDLAVRTPDGTVQRVIQEPGLVYIDLGLMGTGKKVQPGWTFEVYPSTGVPKDGLGKGAIRVVRVYKRTSECKIIRETPGEPIVQGDLFANPIFDKTRTFSFVIVEGDGFDLAGTNRPDGKPEEVESLIRRYGGRIDTALTGQTDFVLMGTEPTRPDRPEDDADAVIWKTYNESMKRYKRYQDMSGLAQSLGVPQLNANRFVALMGLMPPEEEE